jgi:hypothetical protein
MLGWYWFESLRHSGSDVERIKMAQARVVLWVLNILVLTILPVRGWWMELWCDMSSKYISENILLRTQFQAVDTFSLFVTFTYYKTNRQPIQLEFPKWLQIIWSKDTVYAFYTICGLHMHHVLHMNHGELLFSDMLKFMVLIFYRKLM